MSDWGSLNPEHLLHTGRSCGQAQQEGGRWRGKEREGRDGWRGREEYEDLPAGVRFLPERIKQSSMERQGIQWVREDSWEKEGQ